MEKFLHRENELLEKLKAGDPFAFEVLFYKYRGKIKAFAVKIVPTQIDPEEIVQEVFVRVWLKKETIEPDKNFQSFLFSITKNLVLDHLKSAVNRKLYLVGEHFQNDIIAEEDTGVSSLVEAIEKDLPETTAIAGRLVKGAAQHNLCELYLAMGTQLSADGKAGEASAAFTKSISFGNKVINGGTFSLMNSRFGTRKSENTIIFKVYKDGVSSAPVSTMTQTTNYFWDLFQEGNVDYQNGNKECIWALQVDYATFKAEDKKSFLGYSRNYGPEMRGQSLGMFVGTLEDLGGRGVRAVIPTMYTRDEIYKSKWGEDMRNSDVVFRRKFISNKSTSSWYLNEVPWNIIYYGTKDSLANNNNRARCFPVSCKIATDKYTGLADGQNLSNLFRDDYFIRLSETILLRAEAKQRSGDKAGAAADVNLVRTRAQSTYMVTAADMDDNFNAILDERARELAYEECRWNTLLRMGGTIAFDRIKKYTYWDENRATMSKSYNLWPIPQTVIDSNTGAKIEQNPGW